MDEQTTHPKKRSKLPWILGVSLAVNLLFVGLIGGAAYRFAEGPGAGPHRGGPGKRDFGAPYVWALPEAHKQAFHQQMRQERGGTALPSRAERRQFYNQIILVLRSENFTEAEMHQAFAAQRDAILGVQQTAQMVWIRQVGQMSLAERMETADRLEEKVNRHKNKWRKPFKD